MRAADVQGILDAHGVDRRSYRINQPPDNNTMCLIQKGKKWSVFYFERGEYFDMQRFSSEDAACEYFLNRMLELRW